MYCALAAGQIVVSLAVKQQVLHDLVPHAGHLCNSRFREVDFLKAHWGGLERIALQLRLQSEAPGLQLVTDFQVVWLLPFTFRRVVVCAADRTIAQVHDSPPSIEERR